MPDRRRAATFGLLALLACILFVLAGPADCSNRDDDARADLCRRAVPAVAARDAPIEILHVGPGSAPNSMRVDYRIGGGSGDSKARRVVCGFGAGTDLLSVTTESGALTGPSVYFLKHYYLDTPASKLDEPRQR